MDVEWGKNSEALKLACHALPSYCVQQRWYPAKDAKVSEFSLSELIPLQHSGHAAAMAVWNATVEGRKPFQLFIPLAVIPRGELRGANLPIIGTLEDGRLVIDALQSDSFIKEFVGLMLPGSGAPSSHLQTGHADRIAALRDIPASQWHIKRSSGEQSNTSIRIGDISILKVIRKIAPGIHPELEMARFLTEKARFRGSPALLGWINFDENTIAILQEFIPNQGDGWTWIRAQLQAGAVGGDRALKWLAMLAQRTAELHEALDIGSDDEAFKSEIAARQDWQRWARDLAAMAARVREALATRHAQLDSKTRRLAAEFHESVQGLDEWLLALTRSSPAWRKIRHHGDYHLGKVLVCGDDAAIVDFEGEPMRSLEERRAKHVPLRDVAGMLRSIHYASAVAQRELPAGMLAAQRASEVNRLNHWSADACRIFTESYLQRLGDGSSGPIDRAAATRILQFFLIEKGLYEILYELSNRPEWTSIPLQGVIVQFEQLNARCHRMPFGAETQPGGGTRFRIWAPGCPGMALAIRSAEGRILRTLTMSSLEGGWHEVVDATACAGTLYDYVLPDGTHVPDPASRFQPEDVHGPSEVIDPNSFRWSDSWDGRAWEEAVIYELHVGTFTSAGTFRAAIERLDHLVALGVSAIELMPVADFSGTRNWGYDGVLWYAPDSSYGRPEDFKALIEAAHARNIMVLLDVVYNHFGPDGNWLPTYAPEFFTDRHRTPWGAAVNYDGPHARTVREFVIENALYWLEEYNLDGLRLDAVHAILDDSPRHLLEELAQRVRAGRSRPVHLLLENEDNSARWLSRQPSHGAAGYSAQWNDDVHHALHVAATGESQGYYADYAGQTEKLGRALAEGFAFQGETMPYSGRRRGEPSDALSPSSFVAFIQNHDQVGNRAFGDRIIQAASSGALRAITAIYLLLPQIPMLFMGEEWGSTQPFPFFCDFDGDLAKAVVKGRREEFAKFPEFQDESQRARIPDPQAESTFLSAKLRWEQIAEPAHAAWLEFYRRLLAVRRAQIVPHLKKIRRGGRFEVLGVGAVRVSWHLDSGGRLLLEANLSNVPLQGFNCTSDGLLWLEGNAQNGEFSPWSVRWSLSGQVAS